MTPPLSKEKGKTLLLDSVRKHLESIGIEPITMEPLIKSMGEAYDVGYIYGLVDLKELNTNLDTPEVMEVVLRESQAFIITSLQEENATLQAKLAISKFTKLAIN